MSDKRSRGWVYTLNNYTEEELAAVTGFGQRGDVSYMIVGREVGDEKGTPHLQGYVEFKNPMRLSTLRAHLGGRAHWEVRRGSPSQAAEYCRKEHDFIEFGQPPRGQGHRSDLDSIGTAVLDGMTTGEVARMHPGTFIKFHKGIAALTRSAMTERDIVPTVVWLWGGTGVGKTRRAVDNTPGSVYIKDGTQWWDGYDQQRTIVIDDFDGAWPFRDLLRLLDRYPYQGQCKGGYIPVNSPYIFITCEHPPSYFYQGTALEQVNRRLSSVEELKLVTPHDAELMARAVRLLHPVEASTDVKT